MSLSRLSCPLVSFTGFPVPGTGTFARVAGRVRVWHWGATRKGDRDIDGSDIIAFMAIVNTLGAGYLIGFAAIVVLFAKFTQFAGSVAFRRWLKAVTGVVFIGFGAKLATVRP
ncbi:MAG: hypothetical protein AAFQ39_06980, partial [Pseudomonadota bacterium]